MTPWGLFSGITAVVGHFNGQLNEGSEKSFSHKTLNSDLNCAVGEKIIAFVEAG
jgi:hypothetical protein